MPYHSYLFFDAEPGVHALTEAQMRDGKAAFAGCLEGREDVRTVAYATLALKAGTRFMLHMSAASPDAIQLLARDLLRTTLGRHLRITRAFLGMTRASQYAAKHDVQEGEPEKPRRYLIIYPFTKTIEWHLLPAEARRDMMRAHIDVGRKYSDSISQLLLYSYGIDDNEFVVSYQTEKLEEFQALVIELRGTEARRYTLNDLPVFTCIHKSPAEALEML